MNTPDASTNSQASTAETGNEAAQATKVEPLPSPDPLLTTPATGLSEEEARWRSPDHSRLNRKHKPVISQERAEELQARRDEVEKLIEEQKKAREAEDRFLVHELDVMIARRSLTPYDQATLRFYEANGLLDDRDREYLRAAEARREKKAEKQQAGL